MALLLDVEVSPLTFAGTALAGLVAVTVEDHAEKLVEKSNA
jgi:hypothetical protein